MVHKTVVSITENIIEQKQRLRREAVLKRNFSQIHASSNTFTFEKLRTYPWFTKSKIVMIYASQPFEFPTRDLFELCVSEGKTVCAPVVQNQHLVFRLVQEWAALVMSEKNILEPLFGPEISPQQIDLFFVPLVAFDRSGYRLGRGGGYFDRLFSDRNLRGTKIGLGFDIQEHFSVPKEPHDIPMDYILTEKRIIQSL